MSSPAIENPTYSQVLELPAVSERRVPKEYLDENNHMNIAHYLILAAGGLSARCDELGMGQAHIEERGLSFFTAEHHLRYLTELRLDDQLSVHVRLIERSDKVLHSMAFLLNRSKETMAFTFEATLVHVDMETRRPTGFPDDVAQRIDADLSACADLVWPAPLCGVMGVRHR